jgi:hypothetical protein
VWRLDIGGTAETEAEHGGAGLPCGQMGDDRGSFVQEFMAFLLVR